MLYSELSQLFFIFILTRRFFPSLILERGKEGGRQEETEKAREALICCLPYVPKQESNLQPSGVWGDTPTHRATWPGQGPVLTEASFPLVQ